MLIFGAEIITVIFLLTHIVNINIGTELFAIINKEKQTVCVYFYKKKFVCVFI